MRKLLLNKLTIKFAGLLGLLLGVVVVANYLVDRSAEPYLATSLKNLQHEKVGVILGCSPTIKSGAPNPFFVHRMEAAALLYRCGKVDHLLLSGENHSCDYDEPTAMKHMLVDLGIPEKVMTLDYAGYSTLDSMIRAEKIFGLTQFTIISQRDHALRAIFIARHFGLNVHAFAAEDVGGFYAPSIHLREALSRVRALLDLFVFHRNPKYLGKMEPIVLT